MIVREFAVLFDMIARRRYEMHGIPAILSPNDIPGGAWTFLYPHGDGDEIEKIALEIIEELIRQKKPLAVVSMLSFIKGTSEKLSLSCKLQISAANFSGLLTVSHLIQLRRPSKFSHEICNFRLQT